MNSQLMKNKLEKIVAKSRRVSTTPGGARRARTSGSTAASPPARVSNKKRTGSTNREKQGSLSVDAAPKETGEEGNTLSLPSPGEGRVGTTATHQQGETTPPLPSPGEGRVGTHPTPSRGEEKKAPPPSARASPGEGGVQPSSPRWKAVSDRIAAMQHATSSNEQYREEVEENEASMPFHEATLFLDSIDNPVLTPTKARGAGRGAMTSSSSPYSPFFGTPAPHKLTTREQSTPGAIGFYAKGMTTTLPGGRLTTILRANQDRIGQVLLSMDLPLVGVGVELNLTLPPFAQEKNGNITPWKRAVAAKLREENLLHYAQRDIPTLMQKVVDIYKQPHLFPAEERDDDQRRGALCNATADHITRIIRLMYKAMMDALRLAKENIVYDDMENRSNQLTNCVDNEQAASLAKEEGIHSPWDYYAVQQQLITTYAQSNRFELSRLRGEFSNLRYTGVINGDNARSYVAKLRRAQIDMIALCDNQTEIDEVNSLVNITDSQIVAHLPNILGNKYDDRENHGLGELKGEPLKAWIVQQSIQLDERSRNTTKPAGNPGRVNALTNKRGRSPPKDEGDEDEPCPRNACEKCWAANHRTRARTHLTKTHFDCSVCGGSHHPKTQCSSSSTNKPTKLSYPARVNYTEERINEIKARMIAYTDGTPHLSVLLDGGANVHTSPSNENMFDVTNLESERLIQTADHRHKGTSIKATQSGWLILDKDVAIPDVLIVPQIPFAIISETLLDMQGFWVDNAVKGKKSVRKDDHTVRTERGIRVGGYTLFTCDEEGGAGTGGLFFKKCPPDVKEQWDKEDALTNNTQFNLWNGTRVTQENKITRLGARDREAAAAPPPRRIPKFLTKKQRDAAARQAAADSIAQHRRRNTAGEASSSASSSSQVRPASSPSSSSSSLGTTSSAPSPAAAGQTSSSSASSSSQGRAAASRSSSSSSLATTSSSPSPAPASSSSIAAVQGKKGDEEAKRKKLDDDGIMYDE
jgi:hypothetical protein